jgi:hypothetical protein
MIILLLLKVLNFTQGMSLKNSLLRPKSYNGIVLHDTDCYNIMTNYFCRWIHTASF